MRNGMGVHEQLFDIIEKKLEGNPMEHFRRDYPGRIITEVLKELRQDMEALCRLAEFDEEPSWRHFYLDPKDPKNVHVDVWVDEHDHFRSAISDEETTRLMMKYDRDVRCIAHEVVEMIQHELQALDAVPHAGIHLFPKHDDKITFVPRDKGMGISLFDVHFKAVDRRLPPGYYESPFETRVLACTNDRGVESGPVQCRPNQRFFKCTIVSPGEKPGSPPDDGNPAHLDPHIIDHSDE